MGDDVDGQAERWQGHNTTGLTLVSLKGTKSSPSTHPEEELVIVSLSDSLWYLELVVILLTWILRPPALSTVLLGWHELPLES